MVVKMKLLYKVDVHLLLLWFYGITGNKNIYSTTTARYFRLYYIVPNIYHLVGFKYEVYTVLSKW